uniref:Gamma-aminobutyric acid type B receptor subunit 2-like n=1 Tax=Saccoglossus kowalevskii TaxID=10224 RepID=A0ABM0MXY6_SACKO|nr:PREDICTED: gamma-aminobutyric acid type B receptor subunit 2-like [Saccoglossus kowalevskii]
MTFSTLQRILLPVTLVIVLWTGSSNAKIPLHIGGFFPLNHSILSLDFLGPIAHDCLDSALLALEHVNENEDVLKDYELRMVVVNTENNEGLAIRKFVNLVTSGPQPMVMLLGDLTSKVTEHMAKSTVYWNLIQVSYGSHSAALATRKLYPLFFRTISSSLGFNFPRLKTILEFGWKRVAIIHSTMDNTFQMATERLHTLLSNANISILASETFSQDPTSRIKFLKDKDARIIIGNFYRPQSYLVFCEAYHIGMYGKDYVWMLYGHDPLNFDEITAEIEPEIGCTKEQIMEAAEGAWFVAWETMSIENKKTVDPRRYGNFRSLAASDLATPGPFAYDAIWAMALALNASIEDILPQRLENFTYDSSEMAEIIKGNMEKTNFFGVSGPVTFDTDGDRKGVLRIQQLRNGTEVLIGRYVAQSDLMEWQMSIEDIWYRSGGKPPSDKDITEERHEIRVISFVMFVVMTALATLGIAMSVGLLAFNIYYRNERLIKMSSPNLNNVIIIGCVLIYVMVSLLGIDRNILHYDSQLEVLCQIRMWILAFGFTLSFGAMFSKTWRVYTIFTNKTLQKRVIKDHRLLAMVVGMVGIDIVILTIWQAVDHLTLVITKDRPYESPYEENVIIIYELHHCLSEYSAYFTAAILVFKGLLLIFGAFITWQTRNVSIPALNDSKYIALCIYNVFIFSVIGVPLSFILSDNLDSGYAIIGGFILFCTTGTLCLLFIPKIISIVRGYSPEKVGTGVKATTLINKTNTNHSINKRSSKTRTTYVDPSSTSVMEKRQSLTVPNSSDKCSVSSDVHSVDKRAPSHAPSQKMALLVSTDAANGGSAENIL